MEKRVKKTIKIETVNDTKNTAKAREEFILNCRARNLVNDTILKGNILNYGFSHECVFMK